MLAWLAREKQNISCHNYVYILSCKHSCQPIRAFINSYFIKLILTSCRVAKTYVSVSNRQVSCGLIVCCASHDWPNSYVCVTVRAQWVTCQISQKGVGNDRLQFTANNERAIQTLKPSSAQKKGFERIPCDIYIFYKNLLVNLPTGFPASSNHCRCTVAYAAI